MGKSCLRRLLLPRRKAFISLIEDSSCTTLFVSIDTIAQAEISWIYPPRFPKMKNNIKIKTYIKCIHRPAYAYDRPHLNPSDPPLLICVHLYASTFVSPHLPSSTFIYSMCLYLLSSAFVFLHFSSSVLICHHLAQSAFIPLHLTSSAFTCVHLASSSFISH